MADILKPAAIVAFIVGLPTMLAVWLVRKALNPVVIESANNSAGQVREMGHPVLALLVSGAGYLFVYGGPIGIAVVVVMWLLHRR